MDVVIFVLAVIAAAAVFLAVFAIGWRGRRRRQQDIPAPPELPAELAEPLFEATGQYVVTTVAGDWLDRIARHGLGFKSEATAAVFDEGLLFARRGAPDLWIPRSRLRGVRLERGMAGKFVEKDGLVTVTWRLGGTDVDTGFRNRAANEKTMLVNAITQLLPADQAAPSEEQQ
ncbi:hypothetical protein BN1051_01548 [Arthrobacter saudimassiliensis]|uniref:PH domain-containing protein n=1 Tax=Arthrobacter saudimassiliensis TaxID=1461584 RepID=A0A078MPR6_9MICC|nr:hypothetical protein BN1051_01548 [Arthrobacter saudimassiliensis]